MALKEESEVLNEMEKKDHDFINGEKYFSCSQTENTSSRKKAQKTGRRHYFTCQQCGKSFNQTESFKRHMIIHYGEQPYTCSRCRKSFDQHENLEDHMRTHRKKLYTCPQCGNSFCQNDSLKAI